MVLLLGVAAMMFVTKKVGGGSAKYFLRQQQSLGRAEGFAQEMMNGQKVIKVFSHESECEDEFDEINNALCDDSCRANAYANILGPIIGNIGNVLYVVVAVAGGIFLLTKIPNVSISRAALDISIVVPFLNMTKQFTGNVNQLSQQINAIVMAPCRVRRRIFELVDEEPEADDGYVTLVNAKTDEERQHHRNGGAYGKMGVEAPPRRRHTDIYRRSKAMLRMVGRRHSDMTPDKDRSCTT